MEDLGAFKLSRIAYLVELTTEKRKKQNLTSVRRSNFHLILFGACATYCNVYVWVRVRGSNSKSSLVKAVAARELLGGKKISILCLAEHAVSHHKYHDGTTRLDVLLYILFVYLWFDIHFFMTVISTRRYASASCRCMPERGNRFSLPFCSIPETRISISQTYD